MLLSTLVLSPIQQPYNQCVIHTYGHKILYSNQLTWEEAGVPGEKQHRHGESMQVQVDRFIPNFHFIWNSICLTLKLMASSGTGNS